MILTNGQRHSALHFGHQNRYASGEASRSACLAWAPTLDRLGLPKFGLRRDHCDERDEDDGDRAIRPAMRNENNANALRVAHFAQEPEAITSQ